MESTSIDSTILSLTMMGEDEHPHQFSSISSKLHSNGPSITSVHDLLECPVCTNSMYPPIHQRGLFPLMGMYDMEFLDFEVMIALELRLDLTILFYGSYFCWNFSLNDFGYVESRGVGCYRGFQYCDSKHGSCNRFDFPGVLRSFLPVTLLYD